MMNGLIRDLRHGFRLLLKSPGFTLVAVLTMGLGIGANTAVFSVVNAVLLRPLPYPDPDRLVTARDVQENDVVTPVSYPEYLDWKEQAQVFDGLAAHFGSAVTLTGDGNPEQLHTTRTSANLLPMLGVSTPIGRSFLSEEEKAGGARVAILTHGFWKRRFGGDPAVLGRTMTFDDHPWTVIGVLPADFKFARDADVWLPLRLDREKAPRGFHFLSVVGRLRPSVGLPRASAEMGAAAARLRKEGTTNHGVRLAALHDDLAGGRGRTLGLLQGAVGCVLLIACVNVANLLLARSAARRSEIGVRLALGAGRGRILRQLVTESLVLSLGGGGLGLLLAWWSAGLTAAMGAPSLPRTAVIRLDASVLFFTLGLSLLTGLLFGLAPAWQASREDLNTSLKEGGRDASGMAGRGSMRSLLVVAEVAVSIVLLVGAGLLIRSFASVLRVPYGYDPERVLALDLYLGSERYTEPASQVEFFSQVLGRIRALPGVENASVTSSLPLDGSGVNGGFAIEGRTFPQESQPISEKRIVGPGYFRTMGTPVIRGREFDERDSANAPKVAIVNEALARTYFPGEDPVGKRIDFLWGTQGMQTIVGVTGDAKHYNLEEAPLPGIYLPYAQRPIDSMTMVARTASSPEAMAEVIKEQVFAIDRNQPVASVHTLEQVLSASVAPKRATMSLFGGFAAVALLLAALGIYGVMSYSVANRTHEIGLRMALGATTRDILGLMVGYGLRLVMIGLPLGLLASLGLSRLLSSLLFEVKASDPPTYLSAALLLGGVALAAAYVPARRAARVDPMAALRNE